MGAARYLAFAAACRLVPFAAFAQASPRYLSSNDAQTPYTFLHDGHCADGWIRGSNTFERSLEACSNVCFANHDCGFFAFDTNRTAGGTCSLYRRGAGCPDDDQFPLFDAWEVRQEWDLVARDAVCENFGFDLPVNLRGSGVFTDAECQAAASNDTRCGEFLLSDASECSCTMPGQDCQVVSGRSIIFRRGGRIYRRGGRIYRFMHEGHCADGWIQPNTMQNSLDDCGQRCIGNPPCGFVALDFGGHECALYSRGADCGDDDKFQSYNAYKINREWVVYRSSSFCSTPANNRISLGQGTTLTLAECQAAAVQDVRCGPFAISNAPQGSLCQCVRKGIRCELEESSQGSTVYTWDTAAGA